MPRRAGVVVGLVLAASALGSGVAAAQEAEAQAVEPSPEEMNARRETRTSGLRGDGEAEESTSDRSPLVGITVLAASGVVAIAGMVVLMIGAGDYSSLANIQEGTAWPDIEGQYNRAPILVTAGAIATALGVAGAAVGIVLVMGSSGGSETSVAIGPGSILVRGRF